MGGQVYFGTKGNMQWVPAPALNMGAGKTGFAGRADFLNGGVWVRRSKSGAKTYNMSWNLERQDDIQPILDYADGLYGDGPIYFLDPFAAHRNVLPSYWATPYVNAYDGPVIVGDARPTLVGSDPSTSGFPVESAVYTVTSTGAKPSVFVPIPPTHVGYLAGYGATLSGNATVTAMMHATPAGGPVSNLTLKTKASVTDATNVLTIPGSSYQGVTVSMASTSSGTIRLDGLMLQVLPAGAVRRSERFISGQGTSGLSFVNQPSVSAYSAALDRIGVSAELVETEAWNWQ